jgi:LmbE family N-acetylglucosaminyl deacetylase
MNEKKVLMAVLAHPDDETFGMGGTLALYAKQGVEVHLICATRGEVGEVDPALLKGFENIAELREGELRCAAGVLGISGLHFLGYRDSGMPGSPDNHHPLALAAAAEAEVAGKVADIIRQVKPQVVLTFDPIGGYRHPDHIAIQRATTRAFHLAGDGAYHSPGGEMPFQPQRLFFHTIARSFLWMAVAMIVLSGKDPRKFGANGDIDILSIARENFPIHARINYRAVAEVRDQAARCHVSQGGAEMAKGGQAWLRKLILQREIFTQAWPTPRRGTRLTDLFASVKV